MITAGIISIAPVPVASSCKFAFEADAVIKLSVIEIPSSMFKVPETLAPVVVTLLQY